MTSCSGGGGIWLSVRISHVNQFTPKEMSCPATLFWLLIPCLPKCGRIPRNCNSLRNSNRLISRCASMLTAIALLWLIRLKAVLLHSLNPIENVTSTSNAICYTVLMTQHLKCGLPSFDILPYTCYGHTGVDTREGTRRRGWQARPSDTEWVRWDLRVGGMIKQEKTSCFSYTDKRQIRPSINHNQSALYNVHVGPIAKCSLVPLLLHCNLNFKCIHGNTEPEEGPSAGSENLLLFSHSLLLIFSLFAGTNVYARCFFALWLCPIKFIWNFRRNQESRR
jgi:hypothetical protein